LDNLLVFQQLVGPSNLPSLKRNQFQFLLRFPAKYEYEWIQRYNNSNGWLFDDVGFHIDERIAERSCSSPLASIEDSLVIYSIPFDVLKYMRTVHNYELFCRHSTTSRRNSIRRNMEWLCKWTNKKVPLIESLQTVGNVKSLHCDFFAMNSQVRINITPSDTNLCRNLHSLTFRLTDVIGVDSMQHSLLQLILDVSPHLSYLNVRWRDLSFCSGKYPMIEHVHLMLGWDGVRFDVIRFHAIIPKVRYLTFDGKQLVRRKDMVAFLCQLLMDKSYFCELLLLQINKNGNVQLRPREKENTKEEIVAKIDRLKDSTAAQIEFSYHNMLTIWLH
ncbi:unnamed protein product, partial [Adineta ricciae]